MAQLGEQLQQRQTRVEQLLDELKTVNLESLKMASAEELTKVTEGEIAGQVVTRDRNRGHRDVLPTGRAPGDSDGEVRCGSAHWWFLAWSDQRSCRYLKGVSCATRYAERSVLLA